MLQQKISGTFYLV